MKIGIVGCAGRMGRMLVREVMESQEFTLAGGTEPPGSSHLGKDPGELAGVARSHLVITDDAPGLFKAADAVIDFTAPVATVAHAKLAAELGTAMVIGTTGLSGEDIEQLQASARRVPIVQAPNMSVGVNLMFAVTEMVAARLGIDYDIEIVEMHHRYKVDAPSGTALGLGRAAAKGRGVSLDEVSVLSREGNTGPRRAGDIGFATLRGGDVVGDHTVVFAAEGERVELTHKASSRSVFARGALRAARWTRGRDPGFYSMADVLGL